MPSAGSQPLPPGFQPGLSRGNLVSARTVAESQRVGSVLGWAKKSWDLALRSSTDQSFWLLLLLDTSLRAWGSMTSMELGVSPRLSVSRPAITGPCAPAAVLRGGRGWGLLEGSMPSGWLLASSHSSAAVAIAVTRALCYTVPMSSPALVLGIPAHPCLPGG